MQVRTFFTIWLISDDHIWWIFFSWANRYLVFGRRTYFPLNFGGPTNPHPDFWVNIWTPVSGPDLDSGPETGQIHLDGGLLYSTPPTRSAIVRAIFTVETWKQQHTTKKIATIDRLADLLLSVRQVKTKGVVHAKSIKVFKTRLDKFLEHCISTIIMQEIKELKVEV